jgi:hypothetical protein
MRIPTSNIPMTLLFHSLGRLNETKATIGVQEDDDPKPAMARHDANI